MYLFTNLSTGASTTMLRWPSRRLGAHGREQDVTDGRSVEDKQFDEARLLLASVERFSVHLAYVGNLLKPGRRARRATLIEQALLQGALARQHHTRAARTVAYGDAVVPGNAVVMTPATDCYATTYTTFSIIAVALLDPEYEVLLTDLHRHPRVIWSEGDVSPGHHLLRFAHRLRKHTAANLLEPRTLFAHRVPIERFPPGCLLLAHPSSQSRDVFPWG